MKYNIVNIFLFNMFMLLICVSCLSIPKENEYNNYTYEQIIKKKGTPERDFIRTIYNGYGEYEYEPDYSSYFTKEELESGVKIRILTWEKTSANKLMIWLKYINEKWIVFNSLEYDGTNVQY